MKPVKFKQVNVKLLGKPPVADMYAYIDTEQYISCWKMSLWERIVVLWTGIVWLRLKTQTPIPMAVEAETPFMKDVSIKPPDHYNCGHKLYSILLMLIFCTQFTMYSQTMSQREWKENVGIISEMLISEGMLGQDSNGVWYSNIKTPLELEALYEKYKLVYNDVHDYNSRDIILGSVYSTVSGIGLGMLESHAFGYTYPDLDSDGWLQNYLTMNTSGDQFFKFHHPNKIGRELNDVFDRLAYKDLEKFYGSWLIAYAHHFVVKNTMATVYRGWAKYGKPFYYFSVEFDLSWFVERAFGVGE